MTLQPLTLDDVRSRQRAMWDLGDYPSVADRVIPQLGETLVRACDIGPAHRVLDVAAGAGNASLPAAAGGARVIASDLSDRLLGECARRAAKADLPLECVPADVEALPFAESSFDVVMSCVGVMFAPHHQGAAGELARVCRPGGRVGVLSWTPTGFIGQLLGTVRRFAPPPPAGAQPPTMWGEPAHVTELLSEEFTELSHEVGHVRVAFDAPHELRELFAASYGPTVAIYRQLADEPLRRHELDAAIDRLVAEHTDADSVMHWEFLLSTALRRGPEVGGYATALGE